VCTVQRSYGKFFWLTDSGGARNFDREGPKIEKSCDLSMVTLFGYVITMTALK